MNLRRVLNAAGFRLEKIGADPYAWWVTNSDFPEKVVEIHIEENRGGEGAKVFIPTEFIGDRVIGLEFDLPTTIKQFMNYLYDKTEH